MLRRVTKIVTDWWRSWRAPALFRTAQPRFDELRYERPSPHDAGQPTTLDELEAIVREAYGPHAVLLKLNKLSEDELELVVNVQQQDRLVRVRRVGRKWKNTTRGG